MPAERPCVSLREVVQHSRGCHSRKQEQYPPLSSPLRLSFEDEKSSKRTLNTTSLGEPHESRTLGFRNAADMHGSLPLPSSNRDMSLVIKPCSSAFASTPLSSRVCPQAAGRSRARLKHQSTRGESGHAINTLLNGFVGPRRMGWLGVWPL